jgi:hypothetical protein
MKTTTSKTRKEKHAELIKKYGKHKPLTKKEAEKITGIFIDNPLNFEEIRQKAWSRK